MLFDVEFNKPSLGMRVIVRQDESNVDSAIHVALESVDIRVPNLNLNLSNIIAVRKVD